MIYSRLRWLASDDNPDAGGRAAYREYLGSIDVESTPPTPQPPAPNPHVALLPLARACPHAGPASCGCNAVRRCAIYNRDVAIEQCLRCVRDGGLEG